MGATLGRGRRVGTDRNWKETGRASGMLVRPCSLIWILDSQLSSVCENSPSATLIIYIFFLVEK